MAEKDTQMGGAYANPKLAVAPISSAGGEKVDLIGSGETNENIKSAVEQLKGDPTGFNRNLNKRIKRADNIAQQTRLNIKLDKKEQRQEKKAQEMLDKNPEYVKRVEEEAQALIEKEQQDEKSQNLKKKQ